MPGLAFVVLSAINNESHEMTLFGKYQMFTKQWKTDEELAIQINRYPTIASAMWMTVVGTLGILFLPLIQLIFL